MSWLKGGEGLVVPRRWGVPSQTVPVARLRGNVIGGVRWLRLISGIICAIESC